MAISITTLAQRSVTTAGTRVKLVSAPISNVVKVWITVPAANTGSIYVGDVNVSATRGIEVIKGGQPLVIEAHMGELLDLDNIWVDAATSGDDFQVTYASKI